MSGTSAPLPPNETERLAALRAYELLDSRSESALDNLVTLAADICGTPISLVSLIDANRQWFKAKVGLSVSETPREHAFCAHAILDERVMVVPDATRDPRFVDNPLVTGPPHIRFYAGAPLTSAEGVALGTLCVIDQVPRTLTPQQLAALQILSRQVVAHFDLRRALGAASSQQARLQDSNALLKAIVEVSLDCIVMIDEAGSILEFSPEAERTFGYIRVEVVGRPMVDLIVPPSLREAHKRGFAHYLATGEGPVLNKRIEIRAMRAGGAEFPVELSISRVDVKGRPAFVAYLRDITERQQHQASQVAAAARLQAEVELVSSTLAAVTDGIFALDGAGRVRLTNWQGEQQAGRRGEAVVGESLDRVLSLEDERGQPLTTAEVLAPAWSGEHSSAGMLARHRGGEGSATRQALLRRPDGTLRTVLLNVTRLPTHVRQDDDCAPRVVVAVRDISEEIEAAKSKRDFVHVVSHELRTPVTSIHGFVSTLLDNPNMPRDTQVEFLQIVRTQSSRLSQLVEEILEVARLETGALPLYLEEVETADVVRRSVLGLQHEARRKGIRVETVLPPTLPALRSDAARLQSVVTNLLSNTVKFTPSGGYVELSAAVVGDQMQIVVCDSGPGIPEDQRERVFEKFYRVRRPGTEVSGTGLGLSIVKSTVELLGGTVSIDNRGGGGLRVLVVLPLAGPGSAALPNVS
jgi:PAS domain S-box-containing protein